LAETRASPRTSDAASRATGRGWGPARGCDRLARARWARANASARVRGNPRAGARDRRRDRTRVQISLLFAGRTEARMADAARPERAALPTFSTFSTIAGLAAEHLTVALRTMRGEWGRFGSARGPEEAGKTGGVARGPRENTTAWHREADARRDPAKRARGVARAAIRRAGRALRAREVLTLVARESSRRNPRRARAREARPRPPEHAIWHRCASIVAMLAGKNQFPGMGFVRGHAPLVGADRGGARGEGVGGGHASHLYGESCERRVTSVC
jgi:hypothetical protein